MGAIDLAYLKTSLTGNPVQFLTMVPRHSFVAMDGVGLNYSWLSGTPDYLSVSVKTDGARAFYSPC